MHIILHGLQLELSLKTHSYIMDFGQKFVFLNSLTFCYVMMPEMISRKCVVDLCVLYSK